MKSLAAAALLLFATLPAVPLASANPSCGTSICCAFPNPSGSPGSPVYLVTSTAHTTLHFGCFAVDHADEYADSVEQTVACVLYLLTHPPPC